MLHRESHWLTGEIVEHWSAMGKVAAWQVEMSCGAKSTSFSISGSQVSLAALLRVKLPFRSAFYARLTRIIRILHIKQIKH